MKVFNYKFPMNAHIAFLIIQICYIFYFFLGKVNNDLAKIYVEAELTTNFPTKIWISIVQYLNNNVSNLYYLLLIIIIIIILYFSNKYKTNNKFYTFIAILNITVICFLLFMFSMVYSYFDQFWSSFDDTAFPYIR